MQSIMQRQPSSISYHHHQHMHDGTFHLNFREQERGSRALAPQKGDHWQCTMSSPLNDMIITLCRSWLHTNRPIVITRPTAWPMISRIDMRDSTVFDMMSPDSMERLHAYISKCGKPSCFGMMRDDAGSSFKYDERIRVSRELNSQNVFAIHDTDLYRLATRLLKSQWGLDNCSLRFYKIIMYDSSDTGFFECHRDAVHDMRHVATLVISLESPDCRGGRVIFKDFCNDDDLMKPGEYRHEDMLKMIMFYTDTEHRVEPVTRGYRIMLQYEIIVDTMDDMDSMVPAEADKFHYDTDTTQLFSAMPAEDNDEAISPVTLRSLDLFFEREMDEKCADHVVTWLKNASVTHIPALMMSHLYPVSHIEPATLRGFDKLLYKVLEPHFDVEFMPVCIFSDNGCVTRCVSLHKNRAHHEKRDLQLYVTPAKVHCSDSLSGGYMGGSDRAAPHLNYTAMAMILNKVTKL